MRIDPIAPPRCRTGGSARRRLVGNVLAWIIVGGTLAPAGPAAAAPGSGIPDRAADPAGTVVDWGASAGEANSPLAGLTDVVDVAAAESYGLALRANGTVVGDGPAFSPASVPAGLTDAVALSAGDFDAAALRRDGSVAFWGERAGSGHDLGTDNVAVSAGMGFLLVVKADHTVAAVGADNTGQTDIPAGLSGVTAVVASSSPGVSGTACGFGLALRADGTVVGWGARPAAGCSAYDDSPVHPPTGLDGVTAISAGPDYALAVTSDGHVTGWGATGSAGRSIPAGLRDVVDVSAGSQGALALRSDGTVVGWGTDQLPPEGLTGVSRIAAGSYSHRLAVRVVAPVGSTVLQNRTDTDTSGTAEAFRQTAVHSGPISELRVYLDQASRAGRIQVGLYGSNGSEPGSLLTSGTITAPVSGAWNRVAVPAVTLTAGRSYWLALLAPRGAGRIAFRDRPDGSGGATRTSAIIGLTSLPAGWRSGQSFGNAPASVFAGPTR